MKPITLILIASIALLGSKCEKGNTENCHHSIIVDNRSDRDIYVCGYLGYPDTLFFRYGPNPVGSPGLSKIKASERSTSALWNRDCWEADFNHLLRPYKKIMVFVFDAKTLETTSWEDIVANYKVLKRYDLSLEDLQRINFNITYP